MNRKERKESWEVCCLPPHSDKDLIPIFQKREKRLGEEKKKREREKEDGLDGGIIGYYVYIDGIVPYR